MYLPKDTKIAIVGSSGRLKTDPKGSLIDSFDFVIRFNRAPTENYEKEVGSKEHLRVVNNHVFANVKLPPEWGEHNQNFVKESKNKVFLYFSYESRDQILEESDRWDFPKSCRLFNLLMLDCLLLQQLVSEQ